ncbi:MAG: hypothetical protein KatS3mg035_1002 [Bacteroidia bacterium]|nr:MAG: hypothetical protein KatS3mg035_1002 [Bacteroidia bacterium]
MFGVKTTNNLFTYPLIGTNMYLVYKKNEAKMYMFNESNINPLIEHENVPELTFDEFVETAKGIYLDIINSFN